jgi:hypothetical protein
MLSRSILALTAAAALAVPATALAQRGPGHDGRFAATAGEPVPAPAREQPAQDTPDVTIVDTPGDQAQADEPVSRPKQDRRNQGKRLALGLFQRRVWRLSGEADGYDADRQALSVVVDEVGGLSKRLAGRLQAVLGAQADVLVSARTRVVDADGHRLAGDDVATALDAADSVKVTGKLAARTSWAEDEDGEPVPALRALRIKIVG